MSLLAGACALLLSTSSAPPLVAVEADDAVLRGALALALVEDGAVVVPAGGDAGITLRVLKDGGGLQLATVGASERAAAVAEGAPALVELEAVHRALSLVRATPPREAAAPIAIFLDVDDRAASSAGPAARLAEALATALLDASVPLAAQPLAAERLCVVATSSELTLSWGTTSARCDGRQMGFARSGFSPTGVVADALRLRGAAAPARPWRSGGSVDSAPSSEPLAAVPSPAPSVVAASPVSPAAPAPPVPAPASPIAVAPTPPAPIEPTPAPPSGAPTSATSPPAAAGVVDDVVARPPAPPAGAAAPFVDVRVGALGRLAAVDPLVEAELVWPLLREQGIGPAAWFAASGALEPVPIGELALGGGIGGAWRVADRVDLCAALVAGAWAHGWRYAAADAGIAFDALVAAPLSIAWRPGAFGLSLALTPGGITRSRTHQIQGEVAWQRSAVFLGISAGLTWGIPAGAPDVENSSALPRGEGDG